MGVLFLKVLGLAAGLIEIESLLGLAVSLREVRRSASNHVDQMDLTGNITNMKFTSKHCTYSL